MSVLALEILLEDNHLLGVAKPPGMLVQGDGSGAPTVVEAAKVYLKKKYDKPGNVFIGLVHRLDRPTSGVLLLARTSKAASRLAAEFREGTVRKTYRAVVEGRPPEEYGELVAHLAAKGDAQGVTRGQVTPFPGSREARLRFRVLGAVRGRSELEVDLLTGRRHQIRVQLALAGWPIWGDRKYGGIQKLPDRRIALHAQKLVVAHPVTRDPVVLEAGPPAGWPWPP